MIKLTVVVCTYNRARILSSCIESLTSQTAASESFEVIIVDNASTDSTRELVESWSNRDPRIQYVFEPSPGLAIARNTALERIQSDLIAFTDDDAEVANNWVEGLLKRFNELSLNFVAVGGEIDPVWEKPRPEWLSIDLLRALSAGLQWSEEGRPIQGSEWITEVNSAYRVGPLKTYGGFPAELGRQGDLLLSGENFVNEAMRRDGYQIYFDPLIRVKHHIPSSRITKEWFRRRFFWQGVTAGIVHSVGERYKMSIPYWHAIDVPMSPRDWLDMLSNDTETPFDESCNRIQNLGYILSVSKVIKGR